MLDNKTTGSNLYLTCLVSQKSALPGEVREECHRLLEDAAAVVSASLVCLVESAQRQCLLRV